MPKHLNVMLSSTARDLPEHRQALQDACLRQGMFPVMMEHLPASDDEAIRASLKMVDDADIYFGVFAHRYGYVPKGHNISVTEMEYNRAVERKIPRLIFVMDKQHPITIDEVELGEGAAKLEVFKKRLLVDKIVNFFKSPDELRAFAINSLSQHYGPAFRQNLKDLKTTVTRAMNEGRIEPETAKELRRAFTAMEKHLDSDVDAAKDLKTIREYVAENGGTNILESVASELAAKLDFWAEDYRKITGD